MTRLHEQNFLQHPRLKDMLGLQIFGTPNQPRTLPTFVLLSDSMRALRKLVNAHRQY